MRRISAVALLVSILGVLWSCGGGGGPESSPERMRVFQAAPNYSELTVQIDDEAPESSSAASGRSSSAASAAVSSAASSSAAGGSSSSAASSAAASKTAVLGAKSAMVINDLPYGQATEYFDVLEGERRIRVKTDRSVLPLIDEKQTVASGKEYSYFVYEQDDSLKSVLREDDNEEPEQGQFRLRIANFAPHAAAVDVYIYRPGDDMDDVEPIISNLTLGSFADYLALDEGVYRLRFFEAGSRSQSVLDAGRLELQNGDVATVVLLDEEGGGDPQSVALLLDVER